MPEDYETDPDTDDGADADAAPSGVAGDGLPGVAVPGHADLRAGAFGVGQGALGLYRVGDDQDAGATAAKLIPAAYQGSNDEATALPDYIAKSPRWNDPDALAYELDRRQRQLGDAQALGLGSLGAGTAQQVIFDLAKAAPAAEALSLSSPLAWGGIGAGYMSTVEAPRLEAQVKALRARLQQLRGNSGT